jgi:hypothetical protein
MPGAPGHIDIARKAASGAHCSCTIIKMLTVGKPAEVEIVERKVTVACAAPVSRPPPIGRAWPASRGRQAEHAVSAPWATGDTDQRGTRRQEQRPVCGARI